MSEASGENAGRDARRQVVYRGSRKRPRRSAVRAGKRMRQPNAGLKPVRNLRSGNVHGGRGDRVGRIAGVIDRQGNLNFDGYALRGGVAADKIANAVDEMQAIDDGLVAIVSVSNCPDLGRVLPPNELEFVAIGLEQAATAIAEGP